MGSEISRDLGVPGEGDLDRTMEDALGRDRYRDWHDGFYNLVSPGLVSPFGNESVTIEGGDAAFFRGRWEPDFWFRDHGCLEVDLEHLRIKMDASLRAIDRLPLSVLRACR